ncbi:MAG: ribosome recycling factor [candidate division Zixibacteria bacterium SM23_73_3]|nr:MAG: ribosome recycling factor [candidate division Zixibacteria bacterium SM23_73_3]
MTVKKIHRDTEERMEKAVETIRKEFASIRTGKATTSLLEGIRVDYYGTMTHLSQVANISVPDARLLVIQPWEKKLIPEIVKAIQKSDLGLNPQSDPNVVRLPIPPLTEERRKDLVKLVKKVAEEGKIAIRNIRRDSNDAFKNAEKDKEISEDESRKGQERVQEITNEHIEKIEETLKKKEQEIMEI